MSNLLAIREGGDGSTKEFNIAYGDDVVVDEVSIAANVAAYRLALKSI